MTAFISFIITALIFLRIIAWLVRPLIKPVAGTVGIVALIVYLLRRHKNG